MSTSARTGSDGLAFVESVPPGNYKLTVWHPGLPADEANETRRKRAVEQRRWIDRYAATFANAR
jgi:hypothetical protein